MEKLCPPRKAAEQEIKILAKIIKQTLSAIGILQVSGNEQEILQTATKLKITFYDAYYAYHANIKHLTLITEDSQLLRKIATCVNTSKLSDSAQPTK